MIREMHIQPPAFSHLTERFKYYDLFDKKGTYAYLATGVTETQGEIHIEMVRWLPSVLKSMKQDWELVLDMFRAKGCKTLAVANTADDDKWPKFIAQFGFNETKLIRFASRRI